MNRRVLIGVLALTIGGGLAACGGEDEATDTPVSATVAGGTGDASRLSAQRWLGGFALGGEVSPEGRASGGATSFAPGEPVHLSMEVGDAPPASAVRVVWVGPGDTPVGDETKTVIAGQKTLQFQAPDTALWAPGEYRVEAWVTDERVHTGQFRIEGETPAATQS